MTTKTCASCSLTLSLTRFYTHTTIFNKEVEYFDKCKTCTREWRKSTQSRELQALREERHAQGAAAKDLIRLRRIEKRSGPNPRIPKKRCHTCAGWLPRSLFFQWLGESRKRTSRDCRACTLAKGGKAHAKEAERLNVIIAPLVPPIKTAEHCLHRTAGG